MRKPGVQAGLAAHREGEPGTSARGTPALLEATLGQL